jgi:Zn-dependent protease
MSSGNIFYQVAVFLMPMIVAITLHEVAHGYAALALGDQTARRLGRLSLNPISHVDPVGTIALPMMLAIMHAPVFGWAKPVPVVTSGMRQPRLDMALVGMAGPASNLVLGLLGAFAYVLFLGWQGDAADAGVAGFVADSLYSFLWINVFLAIFNMIPLPPFDGGHVVAGVLPEGLAEPYARLGRYGFLIMVVLLVILPSIAPEANFVARVIGPVANGVRDLFLHIAASVL